MKNTLFFLLISSLVIFSTQSRSIIPRPQPLSSLKQDEGNCSYAVNKRTSCSSPPITWDSISLRSGDANGNENPAPCLYRALIWTSCSSPRYTRDRISLVFGDANGNQVLMPNLDDPESGRFRRCRLDSFLMYGPCMNPTMCYFLLNRSGNDGWIPRDVLITERLRGSDYFVFDVPLPNNTWFGYYNCFDAKADSLAVKQ